MLFEEATITEPATDAGNAIFTPIDWGSVWNEMLKWCMTTGVKILIALVIMFVSFKIINVVSKKLLKRLEKKNVDKTIIRVSNTVINTALKLIVLVCLIGYVGIQTASISAVIASLGVGVSMAVQGTLSNFAGGLIIVVMRPFKIGDYITSNGESGTVEDIQLFYTRLVTPDNKAVMIPNGSLANNVIVNVSAKDTRRVDVVMSIAYDADVNLAKQLIREVCSKNEAIFKEPAPFIEIGEYADSSVNLFVRVWTKSSNYWPVNFYLLKDIKEAFDANGIEIPFNQLDVNIKK